MTIGQVLEQMMALQPGCAQTQAQLCDSLNVLEAMVQTDLFKTYPGKALVRYVLPQDSGKRPLLSDTAFEDLYLLYLTAMYYFHQAEWVKYDNARGMFNARFEEAAAFYSRLRQQEAKVVYLHNHW